MRMLPLPSQEELLASFTYDPLTGALVRKLTGNTIKSVDGKGYFMLQYKGVAFKSHRIIWKMYYGYDPDQVDHINGDRADNRLVNLRIATHGENCQNSKVRKHSHTGLKGVGYDSRRGLWRARINVEGKKNWLGYFNSPEEAHAAYCKAAKELHGDFFRPQS